MFPPAMLHEERMKHVIREEERKIAVQLKSLGCDVHYPVGSFP